MKIDELLAHIKKEVEQATLDKNKDAVNMYLVIKYAEQLKGIDPIMFAAAVGRKESYATEFRKGLKLAKIIEDNPSIFNTNVRAYQTIHNKVNKQIAKTLSDTESIKLFVYLNNGITLLCDDFTIKAGNECIGSLPGVLRLALLG